MSNKTFTVTIYKDFIFFKKLLAAADYIGDLVYFEQDFKKSVGYDFFYHILLCLIQENLNKN